MNLQMLATRRSAITQAIALAYGHEDFLQRNTGLTVDAHVQHYLINPDGVLSNNRHFIADTMAEYQPNGDGTTEGQALLIIGHCHMYLATKDETFLDLAKQAWDAYVTYFYAGQAIPTTPQRWICNWLVNSKEPVLANYPINPTEPTQGGFKSVPLVFTNGTAQIPHGAPFWGEYLDTATMAHRGHMTWESINASVQKIQEDVDGLINWQTVYDNWRVTTGVTEPWNSQAWINWVGYLGDTYTPVWGGTDPKAKEYPVETIVAWTGNKIDPDSGDIIQSGLPEADKGKIVLRDKTINGVWLFNYATKNPVSAGGYLFARNEPWHNRPVHTPFMALKNNPPSYNQLGNAADAELWFIDACYLMWRITGETKYKRALDCCFFTAHEYTFIDSTDKFFRQSKAATTPFTDGISYDFTYPNTTLIEYGRDANGYITIAANAESQHFMEQQSVWFRIDQNAKLRTVYGGLGNAGALLGCKVMLDVSATKEEVVTPTWYGISLPKSSSMTPVQRDISVTSLALMTNPITNDDYLVADARAVTDYGGCTWAEAFESNVNGDREATIIKSTFPNDSAGFIIGFWLTTAELVNPVSITYRADAPFNMRVTDDNLWRWYWMLPATNGQWATVSISKASATLSGYQPDHPSDPEPSAPSYSRLDQITIVQDGNVANAHFDYYCVNDIPPLFNISNGWTMTYRMMLNSSEPWKAVVGDCTIIDYRLDSLAYTPGTVPFSNIYSEGSDQIGAWHGMPYPGYQYPMMYVIHKHPENYAWWFQNQIDFMFESQAAYAQKVGQLGPGCAAYIWNRWDNYKYGTADTWVNYHWGDGHPWAGYQPRAYNAAARTWYELKVRGQAVPARLQQYVENWAVWLVDFARRFDGHTPNEFPSGDVPASWVEDDFTAHMCGLWLAGSAFALMAGCKVAGLDLLCEQAMKELSEGYTVTSTPNAGINGAWSPAAREGTDNGMAFGFYTGEIYRALGMYMMYKSFGPGYNIYADTAIPVHANAVIDQNSGIVEDTSISISPINKKVYYRNITHRLNLIITPSMQQVKGTWSFTRTSGSGAGPIQLNATTGEFTVIGSGNFSVSFTGTDTKGVTVTATQTGGVANGYQVTTVNPYIYPRVPAGESAVVTTNPGAEFLAQPGLRIGFASNAPDTRAFVDGTTGEVLTLAGGSYPSPSYTIQVKVYAYQDLIFTENVTFQIVKPITGLTIRLADAVDGVTFDGTNLTFDYLSNFTGKAINFWADPVPSDSFDGTITTSSANPAKCVSGTSTSADFTVMPVAVDTAGTAVTVRAFSKSKVITVKTLALEPVVTDIPPTSVEIYQGEAISYDYRGEEGNNSLSAQVFPLDATNKDVTWSSDDETVVQMSPSGSVLMQPGIGDRTANVTVTTVVGGKTDTIAVTLKGPIPVTGVTITEGATVTYNWDGTIGSNVLHATVSPADATDKTYVWSSSDPSVLLVDAQTGAVSLLKAGSATVTVTTNDGAHTDSIVVTVADFRPISSVLTASNFDYVVGGTNMPAIPAQIAPANITNYTKTYSIVDSSGAATTIPGISINASTGTVTVASGTADVNFHIKLEVTNANGSKVSDYSEVKLYDFGLTTDTIHAGQSNARELQVGENYLMGFSYDGGIDFKYDFGGASITAPNQPTVTRTVTGAASSMVTVNPDGSVTVSDTATVGTSGALAVSANYFGATASDSSSFDIVQIPMTLDLTTATLDPLYFPANNMGNHQAYYRDATDKVVLSDINYDWKPEYLNGVIAGRMIPKPASEKRAGYNTTIYTAAQWVKTELTAYFGTASPDGTTAASFSLTPTTANAAHVLSYQYSVSGNLTAGTPYTISTFVKAMGYTKVKLRALGSTGFTSDVTADLTAKTLTGAPGSIVEFGNGWFRITNRFVLPADQANLKLQILPLNAAGAETYAGDGTSGILIWLPQMEQTLFATAPYKVTGATTGDGALSPRVLANGHKGVTVYYTNGLKKVLTFSDTTGGASLLNGVYTLPYENPGLDWGTGYIMGMNYFD